MRSTLEMHSHLASTALIRLFTICLHNNMKLLRQRQCRPNMSKRTLRLRNGHPPESVDSPSLSGSNGASSADHGPSVLLPTLPVAVAPAPVLLSTLQAASAPSTFHPQTSSPRPSSSCIAAFLNAHLQHARSNGSRWVVVWIWLRFVLSVCDSCATSEITVDEPRCLALPGKSRSLSRFSSACAVSVLASLPLLKTGGFYSPVQIGQAKCHGLPAKIVFLTRCRSAQV